MPSDHSIYQLIIMCITHAHTHTYVLKVQCLFSVQIFKFNKKIHLNPSVMQMTCHSENLFFVN